MFQPSQEALISSLLLPHHHSSACCFLLHVSEHLLPMYFHLRLQSLMLVVVISDVLVAVFDLLFEEMLSFFEL